MKEFNASDVSYACIIATTDCPLAIAKYSVFSLQWGRRKLILMMFSAD